MTTKLIVVGNGMAPGRMLEYLLEDTADEHDITIFNAEPRVNYNPLMLSPVLSGDKSYADIITLATKAKGKDKNGYRAEFIELMRTAEQLQD